MEQDNSSLPLSAKVICYVMLSVICNVTNLWVEEYVWRQVTYRKCPFFVACQLLLYVIAVVDF